MFSLTGLSGEVLIFDSIGKCWGYNSEIVAMDYE
jgi:hypothetical protein